MAEREHGTEIHTLAGYYTAAACATLLAQMINVKIRQWRKQNLEPGDGPITLSHWRRSFRLAIATVNLIFLVLPVSVFLSSFAAGGVLASVEKWPFSDGFEYILSNMIGIGPMVDLVPVKATGSILDILISAVCGVLVTTALGLSAGLASMLSMAESVPKSAMGLLRCMFFYVPAAMIISCVLTGLVMAWWEEWSVWEGMLFMTGQICLIEDPLTSESPQTDEGYFFWTLCYTLELMITGAIIGILGSYPCVELFIKWFEGEWELENEAEASAEVQVLRQNIARLEEDLRNERSKLTTKLQAEARTTSVQVIRCQAS